jgi:phosphoribosylamine--glycine ligase
VFHSGTAREADGRIVAAGGRVLAVTAAGTNVREAVGRAYAAIERISFPDGFWRTDIGHRAIRREREEAR